MQGSESESESRVQGSGFRVQGSGFRVQGSGFGVCGLEFGVERIGGQGSTLRKMTLECASEAAILHSLGCNARQAPHLPGFRALGLGFRV